MANKDTMAKELSAGMELFVDEVMDFFHNYITHINPAEFFDNLLYDSHVQIPLLIVMINPEMKEDIVVQAYEALRAAVEKKFGKKG